MNLKINFSKKNICTSQGGYNKLPSISWSIVPDAQSYAIIIEDLDVVKDTFIHLYIPYISKDINNINNIDTSELNKINYPKFINLKNINILFGKNSLGVFGYYGLCAPEKSGIHRYITKIYALDNIIKMNDSNLTLKIKKSDNFEDILKKQNIRIIKKDKIIFEYSYKMEL
jgi:Raf kinase inhibitor-like YbhB/YbcL family protein